MGCARAVAAAAGGNGKLFVGGRLGCGLVSDLYAVIAVCRTLRACS